MKDTFWQNIGSKVMIYKYVLRYQLGKRQYGKMRIVHVDNYEEIKILIYLKITQ